MPPKFRRRLNQNRGGGARTGRGGAAQKQFRRSVQKARSRGIDSRSTQQRYDADRQRQAQLNAEQNRQQNRGGGRSAAASNQAKQQLQDRITANKGLLDQEKRRQNILSGKITPTRADFTGYTGGLFGLRTGKFKDTGMPKVREGLSSAQYQQYMQDLTKARPELMEKLFPFASGKTVRNLATNLVPGVGIASKVASSLNPKGQSTPADARVDDVPTKVQSLRNIPEGYDQIYNEMFGEPEGIAAQKLNEILGTSQRQPGIDNRGIMALSQRSPQMDFGVPTTYDPYAGSKGLDPLGKYIRAPLDDFRAQNLQFEYPRQYRSSGAPMDTGFVPAPSLEDVARQKQLDAIKSQMALNTGILANLPEGADPTRIGSVQGSGQGLMSVFDMQDFVNRNPTAIYPQGYPTQKTLQDTGLDFYGGNVAFGNTPEARAALETLRSTNPNQPFINMLGGVGIGGLR